MLNSQRNFSSDESNAAHYFRQAMQLCGRWSDFIQPFLRSFDFIGHFKLLSFFQAGLEEPFRLICAALQECDFAGFA